MDVALTARNLGIGRDELLELLEIFLEACQADLEDLKNALASNDFQGAAAAAHSLKGAALNLELPEVANLARIVELAAKNQVLGEAEGRLEDLRGKLKDLAQLVGS